jgi:hypothetical protein
LEGEQGTAISYIKKGEMDEKGFGLAICLNRFYLSSKLTVNVGRAI